MIALFDFIPSHCPNCGEEINLTGAVTDEKGAVVYYRDADYRAHASYFCRGCGLNYQMADHEKMLAAAEESGGDLARHA